MRNEGFDSEMTSAPRAAAEKRRRSVVCADAAVLPRRTVVGRRHASDAAVERRRERTRRVLRRLVEMKFIDDSRYAEAFVREKTDLAGWGEYKIRMALQRKGISRTTIDDALRTTDRDTMRMHLEQRIVRKMRTVKYTSPYDLRTKLMRYALSLGYDFDTAGDAVEKTMRDIPSQE